MMTSLNETEVSLLTIQMKWHNLVLHSLRTSQMYRLVCFRVKRCFIPPVPPADKWFFLRPRARLLHDVATPQLLIKQLSWISSAHCSSTSLHTVWLPDIPDIRYKALPSYQWSLAHKLAVEYTKGTYQCYQIVSAVLFPVW